jgi:ABC-type bacteriocin/lantibiotic exporter with double-glycine peptidase domain
MLMKNLFSIYQSFIGQAGPDDCGTACLGMLLNFEGRYTDADKMIAARLLPSGGISLLDLRNLASNYNLSARCVKMEIDYLRTARMPCILHVVNERKEPHFVVCFGAEKRKNTYRFLIGDPATQVNFVCEAELTRSWPTGAALYFDSIRFRRPSLAQHPWLTLLKIKAFRNVLLFSIPFLSICSGILGVALSWMLQRGINDPFAAEKASLLIAIVSLLLLITLFKSFLNYIRQHLLISLNADIRNELTQYFINLTLTVNNHAGIGGTDVRKAFADIQKIQNAVSAVVSLLVSEGSIVMLIVTGLCCFEPVAGLINTTYLGMMLFLAVKLSHGFSYRQALLAEQSAADEKALCNSVTATAMFGAFDGSVHLANHQSYLKSAIKLAKDISRSVLWYEYLGTANVITVFSFCLFNVKRQAISYNTLMVEVLLTYLITALTPKICNAFPVISEGARLIRRYSQI